MGRTHESLQSIDPDLMWEFGPAVRTKGHRLVVTPEIRRDLRPLAEEIVRRAPPLAGWEFYTYRLAENAAHALATVESRCGRSTQLSEVSVSVGEHHLVDLEFHGAHAAPKDDADADHEAFVLTECLLGEEILDKWIGSISASGRADSASNGTAVPLEGLSGAVRAAIDWIRTTLPQRPYIETADDSEWSLLELKPEESVDYPEQYDLFVTKTPNIELWQATHASGFCDQRFSRHGETFCYLKLDGAEGIESEKFSDKSEIEDAIDDRLKPSKLGCQIGGGTGLRYSYIELALLDVEPAIDACRQLLREGTVPPRSWIIFHDPALSYQWVGIYDDTPPPPSDDQS